MHPDSAIREAAKVTAATRPPLTDEQRWLLRKTLLTTRSDTSSKGVAHARVA